jgi:hypothetical protein
MAAFFAHLQVVCEVCMPSAAVRVARRTTPRIQLLLPLLPSTGGRLLLLLQQLICLIPFISCVRIVVVLLLLLLLLLRPWLLPPALHPPTLLWVEAALCACPAWHAGFG